jgi:hypothetical protein
MLAGAVCAWAMAGAAMAEPFESFMTLCVDTNGDRPAAHAAAEQARWAPLPAEALGSDDAQFRELIVYANFDPADGRSAPPSPEVLMTGWGDGEEMMGAENVVLEVCGVMAPAMDASRMGQRITDLIGARASEIDAQPMWFYSRDGDRFVSEAALAEADYGAIEAAARERDLYVVYALEQDDAGILMLGAVRSVLRLRSER